jgi:hypothetical protein
MRGLNASKLHNQQNAQTYPSWETDNCLISQETPLLLKNWTVHFTPHWPLPCTPSVHTLSHYLHPIHLRQYHRVAGSILNTLQHPTFKQPSSLGCDAVPLGVWLLTFWRTVVPSSSTWAAWPWRWRQYSLSKCQEPLTKQQCHIPEDSDLQQHCYENPKSCTYCTVPLLHDSRGHVSPTRYDCTWLTIKFSNITENLKGQYHTTWYHNAEHPSCPCTRQLQNIKSLHLPEHPATLTELMDTLTAILCILQGKSQSVCYWQETRCYTQHKYIGHSNFNIITS